MIKRQFLKNSRNQYQKSDIIQIGSLKDFNKTKQKTQSKLIFSIKIIKLRIDSGKGQIIKRRKRG
ncbi:hypothetical protein pb186bvf_018704 [Paramecium bursaria]